MKVCGVCGVEISTPDGENVCAQCAEAERQWVKRHGSAAKTVIRDVMGLDENGVKVE